MALEVLIQSSKEIIIEIAPSLPGQEAETLAIQGQLVAIAISRGADQGVVDIAANGEGEISEGTECLAGEGAILVLDVFALDRPIGPLESPGDQVDPLVPVGELQVGTNIGRDISQQPDILKEGRVLRVELEKGEDKSLEGVPLALFGKRSDLGFEVRPRVDFLRGGQK